MKKPATMIVVGAVVVGTMAIAVTAARRANRSETPCASGFTRKGPRCLGPRPEPRIVDIPAREVTIGKLPNPVINVPGRWDERFAYVRLPEDYPGQASDAAAIARKSVSGRVRMNCSTVACDRSNCASEYGANASAYTASRIC